MPDEQSRLKVLQALSEKIDPEVAAALMECVPPFAWTEIATKSDLSQLEQRMGGLFGRAHRSFVDNRRVPPYSSGGALHLFRRWPPF